MNTTTTMASLENLVGDLLKGELTPEQSAQIVHLLRNDAAALDEYLRLIFVTAFLRESHRHPAGDSETLSHREDGGTVSTASSLQATAYSSFWQSCAGSSLRAGLDLLRAG